VRDDDVRDDDVRDDDARDNDARDNDAPGARAISRHQNSLSMSLAARTLDRFLPRKYRPHCTYRHFCVSDERGAGSEQLFYARKQSEGFSWDMCTGLPLELNLQSEKFPF